MSQNSPKQKEVNSQNNDRIMVVCRVRPPIERESRGSLGCQRCISVEEDKQTVVLQAKPQPKHFTFDVSVGEESTQEEVFQAVGQPITQACLQGYNGTVFCYGQTGSGKTYTTFGPSAILSREGQKAGDDSDTSSNPHRGLVPRVLEFLFAKTAAAVRESEGRLEYQTKCSFYEIFNERCFDLLDLNSSNLQVREDMRKGVYVEGLSEEVVLSANDATEILGRGYRHRHVGETAMNRESSRSHAVFTLFIECREFHPGGVTKSRTARFNLVDLAGSERQKDTKASGDRLKEASSINQSLSALGKVINALVERSHGRSRHISYRDSKLTFLLRDSLGGNARTLLVAAVSPAGENFGETLSTLKFAQRAKMIENKAYINEEASGSIEALQHEIRHLKQQLCEVKKVAASSEGASSAEGVSAVPSEDNSKLLEAARQSDVLMQEALVKCRSLESSRDAAIRQASALREMAKQLEKTVLNAQLVAKLRDERIRRLQLALKKEGLEQFESSEVESLRKEISLHQAKSLLPLEAVKWKLACEEAETKVAELLGMSDSEDQAGEEEGPGHSKRRVLNLLWSEQREMVYNVELEEKVIGLTRQCHELEDHIEQLKSSPEALRAAMVDKNEMEALANEKDCLSRDLELTQQKLSESEEEQVALKTQAEQDFQAQEQLKAQCTRLEKQLEDAKRQTKEIAQDRDDRVAAMQEQLEDLAAAKEAVGADASEASRAVADLKQKMAAACKDNSVLLNRLRKLADELEGSQDKLAQTKDKLEQTERKLQEEETRSKKNTETIEELQKVVEEKSSAILSLEIELASTWKSLESEREQAAAFAEESAHKQNAAEVALEKIEAQLSKATREKEASEFALSNLQEDHDTVCESMQYLQSKLEELEEELAKTNEALKTANQAKSAAEDHMAVLRDQMGEKVGEQASQCAALEGQLADAREMAQKLQSEADTLRSELDKAQSRAQEMEEKERVAVTTIVAQDKQLSRQRSELAEAGDREDELNEKFEACVAEKDEMERKLLEAQYSVAELKSELAQVQLHSQEEIATVRAETSKAVSDSQAQLRSVEENSQLEIQAMIEFQTDLEHELVNFTEELNHLKTERDANYDAHQKAETKVLELQGQLQQLDAVHREKDESLKLAADHVAELDKTIKSVEGEVASLTSKLRAKEGNVRSLEGNIASLSEENSGLKIQITTVESAAQQKEEALVAMEHKLSATAGEVERLERELAESQERWAQLEQSASAAEQMQSDLEALRTELAREKEHMAEVEQAASAMEQAQVELEGLRKEREQATSATEQLRAQLDQAETAMKEKEEALATAVSRVEDLRKQIDDGKECMKDLEEASAKAEQKNSELQALLAKADSTLKAEKDKASEVEQCLTGANEEAERLKIQVAESQNQLSQATAALSQKEEALRKSEEILEDMQQSLQSTTETVADLSSQVESGKQRISTLEASAAEAEKLNSELQHQLDQVAGTSQEQVVALEGQLASSNAKASDLEKRLMDSQEEMTTTKKAAAAKQTELEQALEQLQETLSFKSEAVSNLIEKSAALEARAEAGETTAKQMEDKVKELDHEYATQKASLEASQSEIVALKGELENAMKRISEMGQTLDSQKEKAKTDSELAGAKLAEAQARIAELQDTLKTSHEAAAFTVAKSDKLQDQLNQALEQKRSLESQLEAQQMTLTKSEAEVAEKMKQSAQHAEELSSQLQVNKSEIGSLQQEIEHHKMTQRGLETELEQFKSKVDALLQEKEQGAAERESMLKRDQEAVIQLKEAADAKAAAQAVKNAIEKEVEELRKKVADLNKMNARLIGHTNTRQKIQQHQKVKDELNSLQEEHKRTLADLAKFKRMCEVYQEAQKRQHGADDSLPGKSLVEETSFEDTTTNCSANKHAPHDESHAQNVPLPPPQQQKPLADVTNRENL